MGSGGQIFLEKEDQFIDVALHLLSVFALGQRNLHLGVGTKDQFHEGVFSLYNSKIQGVDRI